jgi:UDP-N-acetyl-2-amino-2-deoxyglucuronate dehydrogenase
MARKRYEIAVIGCGKIWETGHRPGLKEIPDAVRVRYVHDANLELARRAAQDTGGQCVDDPVAVYDDPAVDIVAILTPPFARVDYVTCACAAGKHLLLEKPMARTLAQALEVFRAVREADVKCFIPFARALGHTNRALAEQVARGSFGEPVACCHTFLGTPYPWIPLDHWMHDQAQSGGPLFDYSIHFLELARACLGEAESATYGGAVTTGRVQSDDQATLLVQYAHGRYGTFTRTWNFPPGCKYVHTADHIVCRDAVIALGKKVEIHTAGGVKEFEAPKPRVGGRAQAFLNLIEAIESNAPLYADELNGLRMNEILDAMERSRTSGRKEKVELHPA